MAGFPVAKLNSFGKVRVGFTTCNTECFKMRFNYDRRLLSTHWWFHRNALLDHGLSFHKAAACRLRQSWRHLKVNARCRDCGKNIRDQIPLLFWRLQPSSACISSSPKKQNVDFPDSQSSSLTSGVLGSAAEGLERLLETSVVIIAPLLETLLLLLVPVVVLKNWFVQICF